MAISRFSTSRLTQGLPKYQGLWDQDNVQQGAMVPIATVTLAADSGSINFASIPQDYQDLMIVARIRDTNASGTPAYFNYMNNNGGSVYSATQVQGDGSSGSSGRISNQGVMGIGLQNGSTSTAGLFSFQEIHILDYKSSNFKSILFNSSVDNAGSGATRFAVGLFRDTNPITQFSFNAAATFVNGSTATLYGIKASV
jgi:hypothetical protein